jgi:hypothetical protein
MRLGGLPCFALCAAAPAWPKGPKAGPSETVFIIQIGVLLVVGRAAGELMLRIGQPAVMGQLIAGIMLGPSLLGLVWPDLQHMIFPRTPEQKAMIDAVAQLGVLMLLLLAGWKPTLACAKKTGRRLFHGVDDGIAGAFSPAASRSAKCCRTPCCRNPDQRLGHLALSSAPRCRSPR